MGKYIVAGGSGFIGKHLSELLLSEGHRVYVLTTQQPLQTSSNPLLQFIHWNPKEQSIDESFKLTDCNIINFAGANVAEKRWTDSRKKEILESRTNSLLTLFQAIQKKQIQANHLVSASAIGYYGEGAKLFTEEDPGDDSFLSSTCRQWEEAAWQFAQLNLPVAIGRIGIVLGKEGGALREFLKPLKFGIAGIPSDGKQIYSWIHVDDVSRLFYYLSSNNKEGIFNAVAPYPVSVNQIFTELIRHTHPFIMKTHAPEIALRMMLGEMAIEVLKSNYVSSEKIQRDGFEFHYKRIDQCIDNLMH